jgi:excisionase family DNA binding protein
MIVPISFALRPQRRIIASENMPRLLRIPTIAKVLDVSQGHVRRMMHDGMLPFVRVGKRSVRVDEQQLNAWIAGGGTFEHTLNCSAVGLTEMKPKPGL